jgi:hypothetical protein
MIFGEICGHQFLTPKRYLKPWWTRDTMVNALVRDVARQTTVLATPIGLEGMNLCIKKTLGMFLKQMESMLDIRLVIKGINPSVTKKLT